MAVIAVCYECLAPRFRGDKLAPAEAVAGTASDPAVNCGVNLAPIQGLSQRIGIGPRSLSEVPAIALGRRRSNSYGDGALSMSQ